MEENQQEPETRVYAGLLGLIDLIRTLSRHLRRDRWLSPFLCLVSVPTSGANSARATLAVLGERFTEGSRRVPHVVVNGSDPAGLAELLHKAYEGLSAGFGLPRLRFRHYPMLEWLVTVDLRDVPTNRRDRYLARELRTNLGTRTTTPADAGAHLLGGWPGLLLWLSAVLLPAAIVRLLFRLRGEVRWFMRQEFLSPRLEGGFIAFAGRLTRGIRDLQDRDQVERLLVHAFLQDLRLAYRRRPWRLAAWRRSACPVLLIDDLAAGGAGYRFLELVNVIRNAGHSDPLLVVTAGNDVPPDALAPTGRAAVGSLSSLDGLAGAYLAWRQSLPVARQARTRTAWYRPVLIPGVDVPAVAPLLPRIVPAKPPLLARPLVLVGLVLALGLGVGAFYAGDVYNGVRGALAGCSPVHVEGTVRTEFVERQCIGYSDGAEQFFSDDPGLLRIQRTVFRQNGEGTRAARAKRNNPLVTLVYFGSLTKPGEVAGDETFAAEREELEGIAAAQARAYGEANNNPTSPYLRVVVANAGQEMGHAGRVVPMIAELSRDDPTVLGVIGLVESRTGTKKAIRELGGTGLPVAVPTLSADDMADSSNPYLQISAPNVDQAALIHDHVTQVLGRKRIFNFYTYGAQGQAASDNDLYVNTLRNDLRNAFGLANYQESFWDDTVDMRGMCVDGLADGVVFFGGRYGQFGAFANRLASDCNGRAILLADDSVNRYMASAGSRDTAPENLPVTYVSKGSLAYCGRLATAQDTERQYFLSDIRSRSTDPGFAGLGLCTPGEPVGERVGLAYDTTRLLLKSANQLAAEAGGGVARWDPTLIRPRDLYRQARRLANPYHGVTGLLRFDQNGIPVAKRLTLLCATNIKQAFRTDDTVPVEVDRNRNADEAEETRGYLGEQPVKRRACG